MDFLKSVFIIVLGFEYGYISAVMAESSPTEEPYLAPDNFLETSEIQDRTEAVVKPVVEFYDPAPENQILQPITSTETYEDFDNKGFCYTRQACMVNGTIYEDGSAVFSTTFCEYCFCIRGKITCVKPKCQLTVVGCEPQYDSPYTCCPARYVCEEEANLTALASIAAFHSKWPEWTVEDHLTEEHILIIGQAPSEDTQVESYPTTTESPSTPIIKAPIPHLEL